VNQHKDKNTLKNWELVTANPNYKNWAWRDLFCYWGVNIQSIIAFSLIASLYLVYNLNSLVVFIGTLLGSLLVYFFINLISTPSQKHGLPFAVILRSSLGFRGAKFFSFIRSLVGIFMFGIQTYFISKALGYIIRISLFSFDNTLLDKDIFLLFFLGLNIIDWFAFTLSIIFQTVLFSVGINFNRKIVNFSAIAVYAGMLIFFFIILLSDVKLITGSLSSFFSIENFFKIENINPLLTVAGTIFAYFSIIIVSFGDIARYSRDPYQLKKGNFSLILNLIIFSFFALFIVVGSDVFLKQGPDSIDRIFTNPTDIIGKFDNLQITVIALIFIILASVSTNLVANFIPSQYSLINTLPSKLDLQSASYIIAFISFFVGIFWLTLLSQIGILSFVDTLGGFFGPIFGLMVTDYYLIKKQHIDNKDIYSTEPEGIYYYSNGWHLKAIYSLLIGLIFSASTIWNGNLMFLQSISWIIGAIISSVIYYLLSEK
jgi:NCS1 family nucleobase:cation symporter-1